MDLNMNTNLETNNVTNVDETLNENGDTNSIKAIETTVQTNEGENVYTKGDANGDTNVDIDINKGIETNGDANIEADRNREQDQEQDQEQDIILSYIHRLQNDTDRYVSSDIDIEIIKFNDALKKVEDNKNSLDKLNLNKKNIEEEIKQLDIEIAKSNNEKLKKYWKDISECNNAYLANLDQAINGWINNFIVSEDIRLFVQKDIESRMNWFNRWRKRGVINNFRDKLFGFSNLLYAISFNDVKQLKKNIEKIKEIKIKNSITGESYNDDLLEFIEKQKKTLRGYEDEILKFGAIGAVGSKLAAINKSCDSNEKFIIKMNEICSESENISDDLQKNINKVKASTIKLKNSENSLKEKIIRKGKFFDSNSINKDYLRIMKKQDTIDAAQNVVHDIATRVIGNDDLYNNTNEQLNVLYKRANEYKQKKVNIIDKDFLKIYIKGIDIIKILKKGIELSNKYDGYLKNEADNTPPNCKEKKQIADDIRTCEKYKYYCESLMTKFKEKGIGPSKKELSKVNKTNDIIEDKICIYENIKKNLEEINDNRLPIKDRKKVKLPDQRGLNRIRYEENKIKSTNPTKYQNESNDKELVKENRSQMGKM